MIFTVLHLYPSKLTPETGAFCAYSVIQVIHEDSAVTYAFKLKVTGRWGGLCAVSLA